jgi:hypothetical protein
VRDPVCVQPDDYGDTSNDHKGRKKKNKAISMDKGAQTHASNLLRAARRPCFTT